MKRNKEVAKQNKAEQQGYNKHKMVMAEVFQKTEQDFLAFVQAEAIDFFNYERTLNDGANSKR